MGTLAQSDLLGEIIAGLGNRQDISTARLISNLNLAQSRLSRAYDFLELQKINVQNIVYSGTPATDKIQGLPLLTKTIHSIVLVDQSSLANSRKLIERPWRWFDEKFPVPEFVAPGWPDIYTRWGTSIIVFPPPQAAYQLNIRANFWPTPFTATNGTQFSDFDNKDDILIDLTLSRIFRSLGPATAGLAEEYLNSAIMATKEAIAREGTRPDMQISRDVKGLNETAAGQYWADPFIKGVWS